MRTEIEFIKLPDGTQPVLWLLNDIRQKATSDPDMMQMLKLIANGLVFLKNHGMPLAKQQYFVDELEDGRPYTIRLIKELRDHVPLFEFRVNWKSGAFRLIFFEYIHGNVQILVMTKAVIKYETYSEEFEKIADESDRLYAAFTRNPEQYINLEGVEQHE
ncbi:hypothetical protein [Paenibacillus hubeiensis]|uniref:hypothetical protein n=1 Tax=Paenibacillus hubeiensis TaxID=3077330 RepID=UPI0031BAB5AA